MNKSDKRIPFISLWQQALRDSKLKSTTKLLGLIMSTYMNKDGHNCFPSTSTLASGSDLSQNSVCTHLKILVHEGWIKKVAHHKSGKGWKSNEYIPFIVTKDLNEGLRNLIEQLVSEGRLNKEISSDTDNVSKEVQCDAPDGIKRDSVRKKYGAEPLEHGTEPGGSNLSKEVQSNTPINTPKRLSSHRDHDFLKKSKSEKIEEAKQILILCDDITGHGYKYLSADNNANKLQSLVIEYLNDGYNRNDFLKVAHLISQQWSINDAEFRQLHISQALKNKSIFIYHLNQSSENNKDTYRKNQEHQYDYH